MGSRARRTEIGGSAAGRAPTSPSLTPSNTATPIPRATWRTFVAEPLPRRAESLGCSRSRGPGAGGPRPSRPSHASRAARESPAVGNPGTSFRRFARSRTLTMRSPSCCMRCARQGGNRVVWCQSTRQTPRAWLGVSASRCSPGASYSPELPRCGRGGARWLSHRRVGTQE